MRHKKKELKMQSKKAKIKKVVKRVALALTGALCLCTGTIPAACIVNRITRETSNTVVFSNAYENDLPRSTDFAVTYLSDFFMYLPITLRQNLNGNRVDWFHRPTKEQVLEKLADDNYQNVIFIGHRESDYFRAKDDFVLADDIVKRGIKKKEGFVLQHTCGRGIASMLRGALLSDPNKGYSFNGDITSFENYSKAVKELFSPSDY